MTTPEKIPKVHIECTQALLVELHEAHDALVRARKRAKNASEPAQLTRLIIAIHGAQGRAAANRGLERADREETPGT